MLPELFNKFVISKVFADVTLACDDGITLRAHKFFPKFKFKFKSLPKLNALTSRTSTLSVAKIDKRQADKNYLLRFLTRDKNII